MLKKIVKISLKIMGIAFIVYILLLNYSLYYSPTFSNIDSTHFNQSVYDQLQFIKEEINSGSDDKMQEYFPEGYIFLHALYALTWKEIISNLPKKSPQYIEGLNEINSSWQKINSEKGKSTFHEFLPLRYGAFYTGWNNYVLGSKLAVETPNKRNNDQIQLFKENCERIKMALENSDYPYLESYRNHSWPADNFVAMASLKIHDKIFAPKYGAFIKKWIFDVQQHLDPNTHLIPHYVNAKAKSILQGARGSSQSLTLNFLYEIDKEFANQQFSLYQEYFLDTRIGLFGIREYPKGTYGTQDVDSGPVIWGIGGSASIVGQRTLWKFGSYNESSIIRNSIEAFGMGNSINGKKKYLFGQLVMADAFIAWSNSIAKEVKHINLKFWRIKFQLISIILILITIFLIKWVN